MRISRPRSRRGIMLVEMLIAIGLFAVFIALAGKLFATSLRLLQTSQESAREVAAYQSAVEALRRDAWDALEVAPLPEGGVRIARGSGDAVTWSAGEDDALHRRADEDVRRWPGVGAMVTLRADPAGVVVRAGEDELRLPSQVLLARKGSR